MLIDYARTAPAILSELCRVHGHVAVLPAVLDEVHGLSEKDCSALGIEIVPSTQEDASHALQVREQSGALSFADALCFAVSKARGLACVTNDRSLRSACTGSGVPVVWGLALMIDLVTTGSLSRTEAERTARSIRSVNPSISAGTLERFLAAIDSCADPRRIR